MVDYAFRWMKGGLLRSCALVLILPTMLFAEEERERHADVAEFLRPYVVIARAGAGGGVEFLREPKEMDPRSKAALSAEFAKRGRLYNGCLCLWKPRMTLLSTVIRPQGEVSLVPPKGQPIRTEIEVIARILDEEKAEAAGKAKK